MKAGSNQSSAFHLLSRGVLVGLFFGPEDRGDIQRYWVFGLCPSSGFFLNNNEKHNVPETGSVSVLR
jgi:hypothetical protein